MEPFRKFLALPLQGQILLVKAAILLGLIRLALWVVPFRWLHRLVQQAIADSPSPQPSSTLSVSQVVGTIETATRYLPGHPKCLARALATQLLLHHYGYASALQIGVAINERNELIAHAWIERDGQVLIGGVPNLSSLTPLPTLKQVNG